MVLLLNQILWNIVKKSYLQVQNVYFIRFNNSKNTIETKSDIKLTKVI